MPAYNAAQAIKKTKAYKHKKNHKSSYQFWKYIANRFLTFVENILPLKSVNRKMKDAAQPI